jgi:hypothetical protein
MEAREAQCACGKLRAVVRGDPVRLSVCHCDQCKRRTGSAFSWNATFVAADVAVHGPAQTYARTSEEGFWARHSFCGECGVFVFYEIELRPGLISIPAGAFADAGFPAPSVQVYDKRACPWLPPLALARE